jgi:hypothetical protein
MMSVVRERSYARVDRFIGRFPLQEMPCNLASSVEHRPLCRLSPNVRLQLGSRYAPTR